MCSGVAYVRHALRVVLWCAVLCRDMQRFAPLCCVALRCSLCVLYVALFWVGSMGCVVLRFVSVVM